MLSCKLIQKYKDFNEQLNNIQLNDFYIMSENCMIALLGVRWIIMNAEWITESTYLNIYVWSKN